MIQFFAILDLLLRELLLFAAFWFALGAVEDLLIDLIWAVRRLYRYMVRYRHSPPMRAHQIPAPDNPGLIAVFVPSWQEAGVIGQMLAQCEAAWSSGPTAYRIYAGCYANDDQGLAVLSAQKPAVRMVTVPHDGPTTKADCLNHLWLALNADELAGGEKAKAILLHDSEDLVHPDELRIVDRLIERHGAIQFPVVPERVPGSRWISGHYCDEFAEAHGKTMVVREAIGAALPLAGVGCAVDRNLLGRIALKNGNRPFDDDCLTEDYELGIRIGAIGERAILARVLDSDGALVGTRAHFPSTMNAAVRQKARWMTGIALAGWDRLGWSGGVPELWMRLHDRRAVLAAIVLFIAYVCLILWATLALGETVGLYRPQNWGGALAILLQINLLCFGWRLLVRAGFVGNLYGWREGLLSIPRSVIANIIAIAAARKACFAYARHLSGQPLVWDKTEHYHIPVPPAGKGA